MTRERRRHPRQSIELPAEASFANELLIGETVDLSLGGVRIVVDDLIALGATVRLVLSVPIASSSDAGAADVDADEGESDEPSDEPFESSMTVRWTRARPDGRCVIGLSFGPLTAAERKDLARLLASLTGG